MSVKRTELPYSCSFMSDTSGPETFSHPETEAALSSNFWSLSLFSVDKCCLFSIIPTHCLLLRSTTPCFQSPSLTFSAFPFSHVLLPSIALPALHGFHPTSAMFSELHQLAIGNLTFSLMKQVGRNSYVSFLVCRRFHCSRDLGEVSCSQSFWLYVHLRSKLF